MDMDLEHELRRDLRRGMRVHVLQTDDGMILAKDYPYHGKRFVRIPEAMEPAILSLCEYLQTPGDVVMKALHEANERLTQTPFTQQFKKDCDALHERIDARNIMNLHDETVQKLKGWVEGEKL